MTDPNKIRKGEALTFIYHTTVERIDFNKLGVKDVDRGDTFDVIGRTLWNTAYSADQFAKEEKVTKTKLAELFFHVGNMPFTVNFNKQPKSSDILDQLFSGEIRVSKAEAKKLLKGEERTLRGYAVSHESGLGRSMVIDVDIQKTDASYDPRLRQVDRRTINWLIVNNVKYVLK